MDKNMQNSLKPTCFVMSLSCRVWRLHASCPMMLDNRFRACLFSCLFRPSRPWIKFVFEFNAYQHIFIDKMIPLNYDLNSPNPHVNRLCLYIFPVWSNTDVATTNVYELCLWPRAPETDNLNGSLWSLWKKKKLMLNHIIDFTILYDVPRTNSKNFQFPLKPVWSLWMFCSF